ncbi:hypothetical protein [Photobacterium aquae]|uniref:hypothetical protein n=1 Tax=Photobacterium aquae TaxID=1195763 RepID=UPI0012EDDDB9|nr:hypothetical protein [Photobacterium aquae]
MPSLLGGDGVAAAQRIWPFDFDDGSQVAEPCGAYLKAAAGKTTDGFVELGVSGD